MTIRIQPVEPQLLPLPLAHPDSGARCGAFDLSYPLYVFGLMGGMAANVSVSSGQLV